MGEWKMLPTSYPSSRRAHEASFDDLYRTAAIGPRSPTPYALQLRHDRNIDGQSKSPLFSIIPKEIRDIIFEHALVAYPDSNKMYAPTELYARPGLSGRLRIATELLRTCKAVYTETYDLPISLNPFTAFVNQTGPPQQSVRRLSLLAPWQYAAIRKIDVTMQQCYLEHHKIASYAGNIHAHQRFSGVRVKLNPYQAKRPSGEGQPIIFRRESLEDFFDPVDLHAESCANDPTIARPISKLTVRIGRTDWWTWEDSPASEERLALDPAYGTALVTDRCTPQMMMQAAQRRREGTWAGWPTTNCWGADITAFKGLKCLELVLETFAAKKEQLDLIIECAKTWAFPMDELFELTWDGQVEATSWTGADGYGYEASNSWLYEDTLQPPSLQTPQSQPLLRHQQTALDASPLQGRVPTPSELQDQRKPDLDQSAARPHPFQPADQPQRATTFPDARLFEVRTIRFKRQRIKT